MMIFDLLRLFFKATFGRLFFAVFGDFDLTAVNAGTHQRIEKKFQDNLAVKTPLLMRLKDEGGKQLVDGGRELIYPVISGDGNAGSYEGDDVLNISRPGGLISLTFNWKQFYSTVRIDGKEEVLNAGAAQAASVLDGRFEQAEITTANKFEQMLFGDGSGNQNKDFNGLQTLVADDPTTGNIGGQSRVTNTQLRNQLYDTAVTQFNTSQNGRNGMTTLWAACCQGLRKPNFITTTEAIWVLYQLSLTANERFMVASGKTKKLQDAGFEAQAFMTAPVTMSEHCPASHLYMLRIAKPRTSGGIALVCSNKRNFKLGKFVEPADQDFLVAKVLTAGELITDAPYLSGVATNITG